MDEEQLIEKYIKADPWHPGPADVQLREYRVPVWALVGHLPIVNGDPERLARAYRVPRAAVDAALAYYARHRALIDGRLAANVA